MQLKKAAAAIAFALVSFSGGTLAQAGENVTDVADSVVKILANTQAPRFAEPWATAGTEGAHGSGFAIGERRILTAAHVIARHTLVRVQRYGSAEKVTARVVHVSHEADLALLTVDDPAFFAGLRALELGDLPRRQQEVTVLGFPLGGDALSITKGVVSRVEHTSGAHSSASLLAIQIDAAVNGGNSGGPVIADGRVGGVVTQTMVDKQNVNYAVAAPVIRHFLTDVADGRYDGFPTLGLKCQELESPALRRWLRMPEDRHGTRVVDIAPGSPASAALRVDDVLLAVNGHAIADDGTVELRPRERTSFRLYVDERQVGERLPLTVWRDGREREVEVALDWPWPCGRLVRQPEFEQQPRYFVFGGLAFGALDWNYLTTFRAGQWPEGAPALFSRWAATPDEEPVILNRVFAAAVNEGYEDLADRIIVAVDGVRPRNLAHLARLVESSTADFVRFTDLNGEQIVLNRRAAVAATPRLLATYQLPADRSTDLEPRPYLSARAPKDTASAAAPGHEREPDKISSR